MSLSLHRREAVFPRKDPPGIFPTLRARTPLVADDLKNGGAGERRQAFICRQSGQLFRHPRQAEPLGALIMGWGRERESLQEQEGATCGGGNKPRKQSLEVHRAGLCPRVMLCPACHPRPGPRGCVLSASAARTTASLWPGPKGVQPGADEPKVGGRAGSSGKAALALVYSGPAPLNVSRPKGLAREPLWERALPAGCLPRALRRPPGGSQFTELARWGVLRAKVRTVVLESREAAGGRAATRVERDALGAPLTFLGALGPRRERWSCTSGRPPGERAQERGRVPPGAPRADFYLPTSRAFGVMFARVLGAEVPHCSGASLSLLGAGTGSPRARSLPSLCAPGLGLGCNLQRTGHPRGGGTAVRVWSAFTSLMVRRPCVSELSPALPRDK